MNCRRCHSTKPISPHGFNPAQLHQNHTHAHTPQPTHHHTTAATAVRCGIRKEQQAGPVLGRTNSYQRAMPTSSLFLRSPHNTTGVWSYSLVTLRNLVPLIKTGANQADLADLVCTKSNSSFRLTPAEVVCFVFNILVRKVRVSGPQGKCTVGGSEGWGRPLGGRSRGNEK